MKIIFCDNSLHSLINFRGDIIKHFTNLGNEVILLVPKGERESLPCEFSQLQIVEIDVDIYSTNPLKDLHYLLTLYQVYKRLRPDYIFHYTIKPNIYGSIAAKLLSIHSTSMIAGLGYAFSKSTLMCRAIQQLYKFAMNFAECVLVLNQTNYDILIEKRVVSKDKLLLLKGGEGVNLDKFTPLPFPKNSRPIFLMIARVLYDKGYTQYVEAAKSLNNRAEFRLIGLIDDSNPAAVPKEVIESDSKAGYINYLGFTPNVLAQIKEADSIVLPSYYFEGLSRSLMEGLACERPIITTTTPGCREIVEDGVNGFLVEPQDTQSLSDGLNKFLNLTIEERTNMAKASRNRAENYFDIKDVISVYDKLIENIT